MIRVLVALLGIVVLVGCGSKTVTPVTQKDAATEAPAGPLAKTQTSAKGLRLFMHEYSPSGGDLRKPTVAIEADSGQQNGAGMWLVNNAHFTFYRGEEESLTLQAGHAEIDEANERAQLTDGVNAQAGDMTLNLKGIVWDNAAGVAESQGVVSLERGETRLDADSVVIQPKEGVLVCRNAKGRFTLDEKTS